MHQVVFIGPIPYISRTDDYIDVGDNIWVSATEFRYLDIFWMLVPDSCVKR